MEGVIPSLLQHKGIIHSVLPGKIRFHFAGTNYYFSFDKGGAAFLYGIDGDFHDIILSDAMTIAEVESALDEIKNLGKTSITCQTGHPTTTGTASLDSVSSTS